MNDLYMVWIALVLGLLALVGVYILLNGRFHTLQQQLIQTQQDLLQQTHALQRLENELHELRTGSLGVGHKVRELVTQVQQTQAKQEQIAEQDPHARLYARAAKLAQQGASVDDIMQECELPKAEAELLVQLHQQR